MAFGLIVLLVPQKPDVHLVHAAAAENAAAENESRPDNPQRELIPLHHTTPPRVYTEVGKQEQDAFDPVAGAGDTVDISVDSKHRLSIMSPFHSTCEGVLRSAETVKLKTI